MLDDELSPINNRLMIFIVLGVVFGLLLKDKHALRTLLIREIHVGIDKSFLWDELPATKEVELIRSE